LADDDPRLTGGFERYQSRRFPFSGKLSKMRPFYRTQRQWGLTAMFCSPQNNIRQKKKKPPYRKIYIYITQSAANPGNGIAAFFHSTNSYIIIADTAKYYIIPHERALVFIQACAFIFHRIADKPSRRGCSGCRSPPFLRFRFICPKQTKTGGK